MSRARLERPEPPGPSSRWMIDGNDGGDGGDRTRNGNSSMTMTRGRSRVTVNSSEIASLQSWNGLGTVMPLRIRTSANCRSEMASVASSAGKYGARLLLRAGIHRRTPGRHPRRHRTRRPGADLRLGDSVTPPSWLVCDDGVMTHVVFTTDTERHALPATESSRNGRNGTRRAWMSVNDIKALVPVRTTNPPIPASEFVLASPGVHGPPGIRPPSLPTLSP